MSEIINVPQLTIFPALGGLEPSASLEALTSLCRDFPEQGETFVSLRKRLKAVKLWNHGDITALCALLRIGGPEPIQRSQVVKDFASSSDAEAARKVLADRLWHANPLLCKAVLTRLAEGVYPAGEIVNIADSHGYAGQRVSASQVNAWLQLARVAGIVKILGVAFALGAHSSEFKQRAEILDVEEFLEDDEDESTLEPLVAQRDVAAHGDDGQDGEDEMTAVASTDNPHTGVPTEQPLQDPWMRDSAQYSSPQEHAPSSAVDEISPQGRFADETLAQTGKALSAWWASQDAQERTSITAFGVSHEDWIENADEALYRIGVAAALLFQLGGTYEEATHAYKELDQAGVLESLYYGNTPGRIPNTVNPNALMLASVVARRFAENAELASTLERADNAADAFAKLDIALGRGLFQIELFWLMQSLGELGVLRFEDLANYTTLPYRDIRDTLYRLGFCDSPYIADMQGLIAVAAAAHRAAGEKASPDRLLRAFAKTAGCSYRCAHAATCGFACRERLTE